MRAGRRERERAERWIREVLEAEDPRLAASLTVVWADKLPDRAWGWACDDHHPEALILSLAAWSHGTPDENLDTLLHEAAHLLAWKRYPVVRRKAWTKAIPVHGREWRRAFSDLIRAAEEIDWEPR